MVCNIFDRGSVALLHTVLNTGGPVKIVMISGKQGSGKTTTADALTNHIGLTVPGMLLYRIRFAQPIYDIHDAVLAKLALYGIRRDVVKDGPLLQLIGSDYGRKVIDPDIWVHCLQNWVSKYVLEPSKSVVIIDDLRFRNEFAAFSDAVTVRLECSVDIRRERCSMWRPNDTHISEVDLDEYVEQGRFSAVLNTGEVGVTECVAKICSLMFQQEGK